MSKDSEEDDQFVPLHEQRSIDDLIEAIKNASAHQETKVTITVDQFVMNTDWQGKGWPTAHHVIRCNGKIVHWSEDPMFEYFTSMSGETYIEEIAEYVSAWFPPLAAGAASECISEAEFMAQSIYDDEDWPSARDSGDLKSMKYRWGKKAWAKDKFIPIKRRGGARRKAALLNEEDHRRFISLIDSLTPFWGEVQEFFEKNEGDSNCLNWVKDKEFFLRLEEAERPSDELLKMILLRQVESGESLGKKAMARKHAARIMGLSQGLDRLRQIESMARKRLGESDN